MYYVFVLLTFKKKTEYLHETKFDSQIFFLRKIRLHKFVESLC